jgi:tetratricopeptide (TPR) repeat protein
MRSPFVIATVCLIASLSVQPMLAQQAPQVDAANLSAQAARPLAGGLAQALELLSRAEMAREEASLRVTVGTTLDGLLDGPRAQCRTVLQQLDALEAQRSELLRSAYTRRPSERGPNDWSVAELESLGRSLQVQRARAFRNQALCYPAGSPDRIHALNRALAELTDIVSQPLDDPNQWQARLEQIESLRLLEKWAPAQQKIAQWQKQSPPAPIASRLEGERLRLALATGTPDLARVTTIRQTQQPVAPETDEAILETLLAARREADPQQLQRYTQQAIAQLRQMGATHGAYWQQRGEARLGHALAERPANDNAELLGFAAAHQYASGQFAAAVASYDRIAALAGPEEEGSFQAAKTAAAILHQQGELAEALARFEQLARQHPHHPEAAQTDWLAVGLAAALARENADPARAWLRYRTLLEAHLKRWPDSPTAQAWRKRSAKQPLPRAALLAQAGNRQQALALYRQWTAESPSDGELAEAYARLLAEGSEPEALRAALRLWQKIEQQSKPGSPRWWRGRRARLGLLEQLGEGEQAQQLQQLTEILYPPAATGP